MGKSSQRKGRAAEIELCDVLNENGIPATPGAAVSYGSTPDIIGVPGVHCEVKRHERLQLPEWIRQAERDAEVFKDGAPAVFFRRSREPWYVCMRLTDWLRMYRGWEP